MAGGALAGRANLPGIPGNPRCDGAEGGFPAALGLPAPAALVASFLRVLEDPARLRLLGFLCTGEHTKRECAGVTGLNEDSVLAHLRCLTGCGYVRAREAGAEVRYAITDCRTAELVQLARSLAADNRFAVSTCTQMDRADQADGGCQAGA